MTPTLWTIGHSTHSLEEFIALLAAHRIEAIADVRRYPGSRRWPQFHSSALKTELETRGLEYVWLPQLGGRRVPKADSLNTAWRSASFRGYADHMETEVFAEGLQELLSLACGMRTAVMCAEAVWWRCHRQLIADVVQWLGFRVQHIMSTTTLVNHPYTSPAQVGDRLTYYAMHDPRSWVSPSFHVLPPSDGRVLGKLPARGDI
ncbi:MAG: DUF488 domain-containing protein, partial [Phycisphaerales bacterium]|nr:DUF488 domain-containing protein [Phycisphaerales bacterium]